MFHGNGLTSYREIHGCYLLRFGQREKTLPRIEALVKGMKKNLFFGREVDPLQIKSPFY